GRVVGSRHAVQFVSDVVVRVPDEQVRIPALVGVAVLAVPTAVGVGRVLIIALEDGTVRDWHGDDVALGRVVVDDDIDGRCAVAVNDVKRHPVERAGAVGRVVRVPVGRQTG